MYSSLPSSLSRFIRKVEVTFFLLIISLFCYTANSYAGATSVTTVVPSKNALAVSSSTTIQVSFTSAMQVSSFNDTTSFLVSGESSGRHQGTFDFTGGNTIATFTPNVVFQKGEKVTVDITSILQDAGSASIQPYVYTFTVGVNSTSGTFLAKTDYATGTEPQSVFVTDIDGDGDADILAGCTAINSVSVLKNNGDGTLASKVDYATGNSPISVNAVDIDHDGDADILTANYSGASVSILMNNGDGTFQAKIDYTTFSAPYSVYASDIDGDGDVDIMTASPFSKVSVLKNNGNGTFAAKVDYTSGSETFSAQTSDVDGDGDQDIITVNRTGNNVSVLMNNGNGTFATKVDYATQISPTEIFAADLDGDGNEDIITSSYATNLVSILKSNGDGTFQSKVEYSAGSSTYSCYASDVDGDGDADILTANFSGNTVSILKNNGNGTFQPKVDYATGSSPVYAFASDIDGDADVDVVVTNYGSSTISILKNLPLTYTLSVTGLHGSVTINPDQLNYTSGSQVEITPTADAKYYFSGWSGDASGTDNPLTITMDGNKTITANFDIQPAYLTKYRTAKYEDWATSVDLKGKRTAAKRKFDKNFFEFTIVADSARPLKLDFGMKVTALISRNEVEDDTVLVVKNLSKITDSLLSVMPGETLLVAGTGTMGKKLTAKYSWGKKKAVSLKADSLYDQNIKGLPMPNLVNVGEELFPKGFGNTVSYYPKTGLVMGIPQGLKKANSMVLKKYADVLTTLAKKVKTGYIFDTANVRCLDTLKKKPIAKQIGATGPDKYQNKLLAEALALKLNIAASMTEKFPAGLGELLYNNMEDPTNSFNSSMVSTISLYADSMLSCLTLSSKPTATLNELYAVLRNINVAFADSPYTIDTVSFGSKTQLKGLRELFDVEYLLSNDGIAPKTFAGTSESSNETPEVFSLNQNYPNPFNPTTQLSFVLGNSSLVTLKVYNTLGQEVATLLNNENVETGMHEITFDGGNLASGVYFYRLTSQSIDEQGIENTFTDVKRMVLIK